MKKQVFGLVFFVLASPACFGQRVQWQSFKFTEENDFLSATQRGLDRYYTQGGRIEFSYRAKTRSFTERLLPIASPTSDNFYSVALSQQIYTPRFVDLVDYTGDMPYAGTLYFSHQLVSHDTVRNFSFTSRLDAGIIGPVSLGEQIQDVFHKLIGNDPAVGWDTQLRNDIVLNYSVRLEKQLIRAGLFCVEGKLEANAGTLLVSGVAGLNFKLGNWKRASKFSWEVFFLPEARALAYNALLQGGILNQLTASEKYSKFFLNDINSWVYSHSTGFQIRYQRYELMYKQINLTPEFNGQLPHYYGSVTFTCWFKNR